MGDSPKHPGYKKMKDTAWIKQGRQIADIGGKGVLDNYNSVNVFDQNIRNELNARNGDIYQRAFNDMNKAYRDTMNQYAARNYNRFGSLNSTPSAYTTDNYQKDFQRQMNDLAYNKAMNYENLVNNELNRRYKTLGMYEDLYGYGQIPYQQDVNNWNIENTNRDIQYKNAVMSSQNNWLNTGLGALGTIGTAAYGLGGGAGSVMQGLAAMGARL